MRFYFIGSANVQKAFKVFIHVLPTQKDWQDQFPKMYCYSKGQNWNFILSLRRNFRKIVAIELQNTLNNTYQREGLELRLQFELTWEKTFAQ